MFKVGDFVRTDIGTVGVVTQQDIEKYNELPYYFEDCELWQPKEGEWCWNNKKQLVKYNSKLMGIFDETDIIEPFIGKLPSFLKD